MLYLAALGMVLAVMAATALLGWALYVRPMRRRHATEVGALRKRVVSLTVQAMRMHGENWVDPDAPTVRP